MAGELINGQHVTWFDLYNLWALHWTAFSHYDSAEQQATFPVTPQFINVYAVYISLYIRLLLYLCWKGGEGISMSFSLSLWTVFNIVFVLSHRILRNTQYSEYHWHPDVSASDHLGCSYFLDVCNLSQQWNNEPASFLCTIRSDYSAFILFWETLYLKLIE